MPDHMNPRGFASTPDFNPHAIDTDVADEESWDSSSDNNPEKE